MADASYKNGEVKFRNAKPVDRWVGNLLSFGITHYFRKRRQTRIRENILGQIARRKLEETRENAGTKVWFSRHISGGRLKHWALLVNNQKYELRQIDATKGSKKPQYEFRVSPRRIDEEQRQAALSQRLQPVVDGFWVCLIGWTRLETENLQVMGNDVFAEMFKGKEYNFLLNNCQKFLQKFADRVISDQAIDWAWFRKNVTTTYRKDLGKYQEAPPRAVVDMQVDLLGLMILTGIGTAAVQTFGPSGDEGDDGGVELVGGSTVGTVSPEENLGCNEALIQSGACSMDDPGLCDDGCCCDCDCGWCCC